jgi:hypothetical protein
MRQHAFPKPFQTLRPFVLAITVIMSGPSLGIAANTSGEEADYVQSQRCSGALSIMTALGLEDETLPIYKYFSDILDFQSLILEYHVSERIDDSVMGDVSRSASQGVILVDDEMIKDTNSLQLTVKHCLSWLSEVKIHFAAQDASTPISTVMGTMPRPSNYYEYPFSDWTPMVPITESAYELWLKSGLRDIHRCKATGLNRTIECYTKEKE